MDIYLFCKLQDNLTIVCKYMNFTIKLDILFYLSTNPTFSAFYRKFTN